MLGMNVKGLAPPQSYPGAPIEPIDNGIQILRAITTQTSPLGEVLAQQSVGVLVASPLPGAVGVHEYTFMPVLSVSC